MTENNPAILPDDVMPSAMEELFGHPRFVAGMQAFLPAPLFQKILQEKAVIRSVDDFQAKIIHDVMKEIEKSSTTQLTVSGLEQLDPAKQYLFISNHRDIVLDSAFLNTTLFEHGFRTSQIAIGDNLMKHRISELIFRMNKSFVVKRSGSPIELYRYSVLLAEYIRRQIVEQIDSVWIAQREGRAKDGDDRTQTGLLKMLSLGHDGDLKAHFQSLNLVPVAISYEFDPCDLLKAQEFLHKLANPDYKKHFEEDVQHMLLGLTGQKGHIHFHFGKPLHEQLDAFDTLPNAKRQLDLLAALIDQSIHRHYRLHAANEVAYNLLHGTHNYSAGITPETIATLTAYFDHKSAQLKNDTEGLGRAYLLRMYANPLINGLPA